MSFVDKICNDCFNKIDEYEDFDATFKFKENKSHWICRICGTKNEFNIVNEIEEND